jgi:hypothetical protein
MTDSIAGNLILFHLLFPEIAEREIRSVTLLGQHSARSKTYGLLEAYCPDPACDCRRVMINVVDVGHLEDGFLAAISFGFDRDGELAGPFLDPLNPQSALADMLLYHVSYVLSDRAYAQRLERHYTLVKEVAADPAHPAHETLLKLAARDDEFKLPRRRGTRRGGPRSGRGSKKHK